MRIGVACQDSFGTTWFRPSRSEEGASTASGPTADRWLGPQLKATHVGHALKSERKTAVACIVIVAALLGVAAGLLLSDRSLTRFQQDGVLRIGYAVEAPYAFLKHGGEVTGESPEVAKRIAARLGIRQLEWRQLEFGSLLAALESGRLDVIAAGMFITPERAQLVRFSEPTFHVKQGLLVPKGNPRQLHSYQDILPLTDLTIAVLDGSVEEALLRQMGLPEHRFVRVPDALAGRVAVETGVAGGLALSSPTLQWMALREQLGKTELAQPFAPPEQARHARLGYGAFAFRRQDRQLYSAWNAALKTFIGSPEHLKLITEFGFTAAELPGQARTAEILSPP